MQNAGLSESQAGNKTSGRNFIYANDTILMAESEEELKSIMMRMKEESQEASLKFNIQKTKIMTSGPTTSWQTDGEKVRSTDRFFFFFFRGGGLVSKITAHTDCSQEIKRCLLLGRKAMTNLDSILKSKDITLPTKVHVVKAMIFLVMYGWESWTINKAEC